MNPNPNTITARPAPDQCWMCHRHDTVPAERRDLIPALCSTPCEQGWADQYRIGPEPTHIVADDEWVPVPPPITDPAFVDHAYYFVGNDGNPIPLPVKVDQVVAEAGPPVTPVTAGELEQLRTHQAPARPVPGAWLRRITTGMWG